MSSLLPTAAWAIETPTPAPPPSLDSSDVLVGDRVQKYTAMVLTIANIPGCVRGDRPCSLRLTHVPETDVLCEFLLLPTAQLMHNKTGLDG